VLGRSREHCLSEETAAAGEAERSPSLEIINEKSIKFIILDDAYQVSFEIVIGLF
jgi:hypothetical protein